MTYKKIAQAANVSLSTVSKALSGSKEISDELRQNIIQIAKEMGYFEGKRKRKIEYSKSDAITIAVICPEIISLFYAGEITAIKNKIEESGGLCAVYVYDFDDKKLDRILEQITVRNSADGIILFAEYLNRSNYSIPMVCLSSSENIPYDTVFCDPNVYMSDMVRYLKDLGHTDIAFVGEPNTMSKLTAYRKAMNTLGIPYTSENEYIINARFEEIGHQAALQIMQKRKLPTAIICAYDEIALKMIHDFCQCGIKIPEQVSIIGINDIPMSSYAPIPLTTIRIFQEEQGALAVNLLYDKIYENSDITQHISIGHRLIERKSVGKAPKNCYNERV